MKSSKITYLLFTLLFAVTIVSCDKDTVDELPINQDDNTDPNQPRNAGLVARYAVSGNDLTLINSGSGANGFYNQARQNEFWNFFTGLIPSNARSTMTELELFADGQDGTAAYVAPLNDNDLSKWELGHNLEYVWNENGQFVKDETAYTSVHEVAHLLTLNNTQISVGGGNCGTFHTGEGCSNGNSYIAGFYEQFWSDIYSENQAINQDDFDGFFAFYQKYEDRFVSEYAATNPGEDIAEVFAIYVMSSTVPTDGSIKSQKIRYLNGFQELVSLRSAIRSNINFTINLPGVRSTRSQRFKSKLNIGPAL